MADRSFKPPETVASNAAKGLEMRKRVKAGTDVGVARARQLSNRQPVSLDTIRRMVSFFARHGAQRPDDEGTEANPTPWLVAWMLWGGDAGRRWANGIWKREGRTDASRGPAVEWARRELPEGVRIVNPKGLQVGTPFRTLTADEAVRDESDGSMLGRLSCDALREMVRVFYAQAELGEGAPRINYNHGPSRGGHPDIYGEAVGLFVESDGRGPGLYVVPGWTAHGADFVRKHETPDGGSVLSNSPEFMAGAPVFARGGGEADEDAMLLGSAVFLGVALTPTPQQQERIIDPVALSRTGATAPGPKEIVVEDEKRPDGAERMDALEAALAALNAKFDAIMERMGEAEAEAEEMAKPEEMSTGGADALALSVSKAEDALSAEQRAELSRRITEADAAAMVSEDQGARVMAFSRKLALIGEVQAEDRITALSRQVAELTASNNETKVSAERARLRAMGGSAERVERIVGMYSRKLAEPAMWSKVHGDACPYEAAVAELKARPDVDMGRSGINAEPVSKPVVHDVDAVNAWARENKIEGRPVEMARRYAKAHSINVEDIR